MAESKSTERLAENKSTEPLAARQYATPEKLTKITQRNGRRGHRSHIGFLSVRPDVCRRLPSDSVSRRTPLPLAGTFPLSGRFSNLPKITCLILRNLFGLYLFSHQSCATGTLLLRKKIYPRKSSPNLRQVIFSRYLGTCTH